jgi:membrane fusion protein (multidrug efflux system)
MVVAASGQVAPRTIKVGGSQEGKWVVLEGLQPGEKVMVDGFQKLRPGAPVKPVPWSAAPAAAAASAARPASAASQPAKS